MKIRRGVKNLWLWKKIIWDDAWFDYGFLFDMLKFKLELMEANFRKSGVGTSSEKDADKMKICILLLDRLIKDDYYDNVYKQHDKKWGLPEFNWEPNSPNLSELHITHKNVNTDEEKILQKEEYKKLLDKPDELKRQDVRYLFKLMSKHILCWWD